MLEVIFNDIKKSFNNYKISDEDVYKISLGVIEAANIYNIDLYEMEILGNGESSLCYGANGLVIKVTFTRYFDTTLTDYVSHSSAILKPLYEKDITTMLLFDPKIIVAKRLNVEGITMKDVVDLYVDLRNDGYLWSDTKIQNVGKDENGNIKLLDYGELIYTQSLSNISKIAAYKTHQNIKSDFDQAYRSGSIGIYEFINKLSKEKKKTLFKRKG